LSSAQASHPRVSAKREAVVLSPGVVLLQNEGTFGLRAGALPEQFRARVIRVQGVLSVLIDRASASARVLHDVPEADVPGLLRRMAAAVRDRPPSDEAAAPSPAAPRLPVEIVSDRPGRLHLRFHALIGDRALARHAERRLGEVPGVLRASPGMWTSSLFVHYDPSAIKPAQLARLANEALEAPSGWSGAAPGVPATKMGPANLTLGFAAVVDTVAPILIPVSAALLVATNVRTFRDAWIQLSSKKAGLPVLHATIVAVTLGSGQFFASALMSWFFKFWQTRLPLELTCERRRLVDDTLPRPRLACLIAPDGTQVLVPVERLQPGDRVVVGPGESVPADGRLLEGGGIVDERSVRGLEGASRKSVGDFVLAGSTVLAGTLRMEVTRLGEHTRAASIERGFLAATSPMAGPTALHRRAQTFAETAVGPTLATAGVGLLIGDLTSVSAILRPDYGTGPGMAIPLETLRNAALCARQGILVRAPDVFERLARADVIVIDDTPALRQSGLEVSQIQTNATEALVLRYAASAFRHLADERALALVAACRQRRLPLLDLPVVAFNPGVTVGHGNRVVRVRDSEIVGDGPLTVEVNGTTVGTIQFRRSSNLEAAGVLSRLRALTSAPITLLSSQSAAQTSALAARLGVDGHLGDCSSDDKARFLRHLRERGRRAVIIGDRHLSMRSAEESFVSIALMDDEEAHPESAEVLLLQPRWERLVDLFEVAHAEEGKAQGLQKLIVVPNVVCVAGAFLFGFTSLAAVVISNLGTFSLYNRATGSLRALKPHAHSRTSHSRLTPSPEPRGDRHRVS
jgi:cation transport ATPase